MTDVLWMSLPLCIRLAIVTVHVCTHLAGTASVTGTSTTALRALALIDIATETETMVIEFADFRIFHAIHDRAGSDGMSDCSRLWVLHSVGWRESRRDHATQCITVVGGMSLRRCMSFQ